MQIKINTSTHTTVHRSNRSNEIKRQSEFSNSGNYNKNTPWDNNEEQYSFFKLNQKELILGCYDLIGIQFLYS